MKSRLRPPCVVANPRDTAGSRCGLRLARIFHQGRARVGCDAVRWQGETTLRARARKEEQRSQRAAARLNRVCSARYKLDLALEAKKVSIHAVLLGIGERPGEICGLAWRTNPSIPFVNVLVKRSSSG